MLNDFVVDRLGEVLTVLVYTLVTSTSTYKVSKFLTNILQRYTGKNFSFDKDSKGLADSLKRKIIKYDETLVSCDVSPLFASIPVLVALEVINKKRIARLLGTFP